MFNKKSAILLNGNKTEERFNNSYGCPDNCLDACTCTGNCHSKSGRRGEERTF